MTSSAACRHEDAASKADKKLQAAVLKTDLALAAKALADGADPDLRLEHTERPVLVHATKIGWYELAGLLIRHGADPDAVTEEGGATALYHAMTPRGLPTAKLLLEHGADPNGAEEVGAAPLHYAARGGAGVEACRLLVEHGAKLDVEDFEGRRPLHEAAFSEKAGVVRYLLHEGASTGNELCDAVLRGDRAKLDRLLDSGRPGVNAGDSAGWSALHWAALLGRADVAETLLSRGAAVNSLTGPLGRTPLHHGLFADSPETVRVLLEAGADANTADRHGSRPLHDVDSVAMCKLLMEHGAELDLGDEPADTALHAAARFGNVEMLAFLLQEGQQIERRNRYGYTPLLLAVRAGEAEAVAFLAERGAAVNVFSIRPHGGRPGKPALHEAVWDNNAEIVRVLLAHGADVNIEDNFGTTPLYRAQRWKRIEIARMLEAAGGMAIGPRKR